MRLALAVVVLAACEPSLDQRLALVDEPIVLAVIATPAEAAPGDAVRYEAIVAGPDGPQSGDASWAYCDAPKPPTEDNIVSPACLAELPAIATGAVVDVALPLDGCTRFGPLAPPDGGRPRDPDPTGGFYQPVRVDVAADDAPAGEIIGVGLHRIACELANAPPAVAREFRDRYVRNASPPAPVVDAPATLAAGATIALVATWPADAAEPYVSYDVGAVALRDRRESMRVSWYVTAGTLAQDVSGVAEDEAGREARNTFTAPAEPGALTLWAVLRDSRGGAAVTTLTITIE